MCKIVKTSIFIFLLLHTATAFSKVILPPVFDNNMVLQRSSIAGIWGKAEPGIKITIKTSWDNKLYSVTAKSDSSWKVGVKTPEAGGPYTISFDDGDLLTLKNILIGEVWVCSGQSNMSIPIKGFKNQPIIGSNDLLLHAKNSKIRLMQVQRQYADKPEFAGKVSSWTPANIQSVAEFSAVGYMYAKILQENLDIPIGVIMTAWGGTKIEAWMNSNSFYSLSFNEKPEPGKKGKLTHNSPTVLYNAMINPIAGYGIKGFIWYQGEANRNNYDEYDQLLEAMVKGWRKVWNMGELPFYYVQIAPFKYDGTHKSAYLREAQLKASTMIPHSGMVVSLDVGTEKFIHAPDKATIAKRLSLWALANDYGMTGLAYKSPAYTSMKIAGDAVDLYFDNAANGLSNFGKELIGFEVAGADKVFYPAQAKITKKGVRVRSQKVKDPVAVRYDFKDWVIGCLYSTEGLPVSSFRTDKWSL